MAFDHPQTGVHKFLFINSDKLLLRCFKFAGRLTNLQNISFITLVCLWIKILMSNWSLCSTWSIDSLFDPIAISVFCLQPQPLFSPLKTKPIADALQFWCVYASVTLKQGNFVLSV